MSGTFDFLGDRTVYEVTPDTYAAEQLAKLGQTRWDRYKSTYEPWQDTVLKDIYNPEVEAQDVNSAVESARIGTANAEGQQFRNFNRYGVQMTPERLQSVQRMNKYKAGLNEVTSANVARRGTQARDEYLANQMISQGQGVAGMATGGLKMATSLSAQYAEMMQQKANQLNAGELQDEANQGAMVVAAAIIGSSFLLGK